MVKFDILTYYSRIAPFLNSFLKGKELAVKTLIPNGPRLLKRGTILPKLYINELNSKNITKQFIELRKTKHLKEVKPQLTKNQLKLWGYFIPRKYSELLYATNNETPGKKIDRIFFDIDRVNLSPEKAQKITLELLTLIKKDKKFKKLVKFKPIILWTGSSFHIYLLLNKKVSNSFYNKYIQYSKKDHLKNFTGIWINEISKHSHIKIKGGHEKTKGYITIDPSQTPSGKLARAPFSLHLKDANTIDGICLPLSESQLKDKKLIKTLKSYTIEKVLKNIASLSKQLK